MHAQHYMSSPWIQRLQNGKENVIFLTIMSKELHRGSQTADISYTAASVISLVYMKMPV